MAKKRSMESLDYTNPPASLDDNPFYGLRLDEEQKAFRDAIWNPQILTVFCNSRAGTGKTTISVATADLLVKYGRSNQILYIVCPHAEGKQGFLPGSISEKSMLYHQPLYQALSKLGINPMTSINTDSFVNQKTGSGYITCITDSYVRGNTYEDMVVIIDEAQNASLDQLRTLLTRCADSAKVIVQGHNLQCDLKDPSQSGFLRAIDHFSTEEWVSVCNLTKNYRGKISAHADLL